MAPVPITLEECEELAPELGARDGFDLACRFASRTLPGVFRRDDPVLDLPIALNDQVELRKLLALFRLSVSGPMTPWDGLTNSGKPSAKNEINDSGKKIGADELAPVTQLFTEDYMVEFLLHNTLGAWWAGKIGAIKAATEQEARSQVALPSPRWRARESPGRICASCKTRRQRPGFPPQASFAAWPKSASLIRVA